MIPSYNEIVNRYNLHLLREQVDLALENGDLAVTRWGDLRVGSLAYNGLVRFVLHWRFNEPPFRRLFAESFSMRSLLLAHREQARRPVAMSPAGIELAPYESKVRPGMSIDEAGALEFGHRTFAGCVVLALSGLLQQFRTDIGATGDEWNKSEPMRNECSFGQIIIAAANGVRHVDEWEAAREPTQRQRVSMRVLESALGTGSIRRFNVRDIPAATLDLLSDGGDFDRLATLIFAYVHNVAIARDTAP